MRRCPAILSAQSYNRKGEYAKAIADYDEAIRPSPQEAYSYQNRGAAKAALGDLDGALADINDAIRHAPALASPLTNRSVIWRAKGEFDRAIADCTEVIRFAPKSAERHCPIRPMMPAALARAFAAIHPRTRTLSKSDACPGQPRA